MLHTYAIALAIVVACLEAVTAIDLEMTIRPHTDRIVFADPVFLELTIVNTSKEMVLGPYFDIYSPGFEFRARDPRTGLEIYCGHPSRGIADGYTPKAVPYEPGKAVKSRWQICLPYASQVNHPFWKEVAETGAVEIWCVLRLETNVSLKSNAIKIAISPRDPKELKLLNYWAQIRVNDQPQSDAAILPSGFQVDVNVVRRKNTAEIASEIKSGELAGILQLTMRMQQLYHYEQTREAGSISLVDWIRKQPDIKRQFLAKQISSDFAGYLTAPALDALKHLADSE